MERVRARAATNVAAVPDLAKDIPFAMFTTVTGDGGLRSRPMVASENAFDGFAVVLHAHRVGRRAGDRR